MKQKSFRIGSLRFLVLSFFIFSIAVWSCKKDFLNDVTNNLVPNLAGGTAGGTNTITPGVYHNDGLHRSTSTLFDQVWELDKKTNLYSTLKSNIGIPFWYNSSIYRDTVHNLEVVIVPFGFFGIAKTQALLKGVRSTSSPLDSFKISMVTRDELLHYSRDAAFIDENEARLMYLYDNELYNTSDLGLCLAYDRLKVINADYKSGLRNGCIINITLCYCVECNGGGGGSNGSGSGFWSSGNNNFGNWNWWGGINGDIVVENDLLGAGTGTTSGVCNCTTPPTVLGGASGGGGGGKRCYDATTGVWYKCPEPRDVSKCPNFNFQGEAGDRSGICVSCGVYSIDICKDNWWNIAPKLCAGCDLNADPDNYDNLQLKCKKEKLKMFKAKYGLQDDLMQLYGMAETCNCIGNDDFETCAKLSYLADKYGLSNANVDLLGQNIGLLNEVWDKQNGPLMAGLTNIQKSEFLDFYIKLKGSTPVNASFGDLFEVFNLLKPTVIQTAWLALNHDVIAKLLDGCTGENKSDCIKKNINICRHGGILNSKTCKESFVYEKTGEGFTTEVGNIKHGYLPLNPTEYIGYTIGVLCIQIKGKDAFGNALTAEKGAELTAFAFDNARLEVLQEIEINPITSELEAIDRFLLRLREQFVILCGSKGSCSVSTGSCSGSIPRQNYLVKPLGIFNCSNW